MKRNSSKSLINSISFKRIGKKEILLTSIAILFFCSFSFGQVFMIGPRLGISSSKVKIDEVKNSVNSVEEGDAHFGFHAGLFARVTLSSIYIQPEVLFTNNGGEIKFDDGAGNKIVKEYEFNKLDVPVMVGFKITDFFRIQAGPVASLLLKADAKEGGVKEDVKSNYNNATLGYQAGIGLDIGSILIDLKYEGNLSKLGDDVEIANTTFNTDMRNNQWLLSIGFKL